MEFSLVVTDDHGIEAVSRQYFGKRDPTDVLSFRYEGLPGEERGWTGEVFVNAERAACLGPRMGGRDRELALYIAHGCDHLIGHTDRTARERQRMRRRELRWLRTAAALGLLRGLFRKRPLHRTRND